MLQYHIGPRNMSSLPPLIRTRLDRVGMALSALCAVHCVAGVVLVTVLGLGGGILLDPRIHEWGLALAVGVGVVVLGYAALRHRNIGSLIIGGIGLGLMGLGLVVPHGVAEACFTVAGVSLVAIAHYRNLRHTH